MREDRSTEEVYRDILRGIESIHSAGKTITLSAIGRRAMLPNNRLRDRLAELRALGLVDANLSVTRAGSDYCIDYSEIVDRFLRKYGLRRKDEV